MAVSKRLRYEIFRRDNHTCRYCGAAAPDAKITIDHVLPEALGGTDTPDNLVTACDPCNSGKTSTTPGAPLVADVAEDALRWAGAMARAAQEAMEDIHAREKTHKEFQKAWKRNGGVSSDLPDNWRGSLNSIIAAGLPAEALAECVDIAFDQRHVYDRNRFKYTCGVAWRKIDKLRERAGEIAGMRKVAEPEPDEGGDELTPKTVLKACKELLEDNFEEDQYEQFLDHIRATEGSDYPEVSLYYFAVDRALGELREDRDLLMSALYRYMSLHPEELVNRAMDSSRSDHRKYLGDEFTEASVLTHALESLTEPLHALKTLQSLPEEERTRWVEEAKAELGADAHEQRIAVKAVRLMREASRPDYNGEPPF